MPGVISKVHLGVPIAKKDGQLVIYAKAHAALTAYQPYAVQPGINTSDLDQDGSADNDGQAVTAAPATLAVYHYIGCPQKAYASGEVAELVIGGAGKCLVPAAAVVATDYLEVINAGTTAIVDGTSGSTTRTVRSFAYACEPNDSAAMAINVQFLGVPVNVAAS
jgi:hypothetical protein